MPFLGSQATGVESMVAPRAIGWLFALTVFWPVKEFFVGSQFRDKARPKFRFRDYTSEEIRSIFGRARKGGV
jgi:hypothetical protein